MATTCPTCRKTRSGKACKTCKLPAAIVLPEPLPPSPPPPPPPTPVPTTNEPAGFTTRAAFRFDQDFPIDGDFALGGGWGINYNHAPGYHVGWAARVDHDGRSVCDFVYPEGMIEGSAPATFYWGPINADEVYVRAWWKPSAGFNPGPNGTKLFHLKNGAGGKQFLILYPDGKLHVYPEYGAHDTQWRSPLAGVPAVGLGQGHTVEWLANRVTGDGAVWLDSQLHLRYAGARSTHPFDYLSLSPTFGGNSGARKLHTDHFWMDDVLLSTR
jgi:hypothetical protein